MEEIKDTSGESATTVDLHNPQVFLAWQRSHLANERTFLAWCRTGLALFAFSFVIERFDFFLREMQALPAFQAMSPKKHLHTEFLTVITFGVGVMVVLIAAWRYFQVRKAIDEGRRRFSNWPDTLLVATMVLIILGLFTVFWVLLVR